ncbi:hypothetical protein N657DRAFT_569792 [Parathielavia appendiculata]|uniref:Histone-lysine N-methyltransferase ASH1L n=1 Tax=Parathielavia appendiculata TaxID=2587402 RepID=A0AAN6U2F8_9PEZI|nr:hypothetical protein N657DRAFT_569792 [Parathielavia appendiculata]
MAAIPMAPTMAELDSLLLHGSSFSSTTPTDPSSANSAASLSSTPPTTVSPDSMSLASESDPPKPESVAASTIEAVIPTPETQQIESEQRESGQPTPVDDDAIVVAEPVLPAEPPSTSRPRRARSSFPVYNIAKLAGTDVHGRRRSKGDAVQEKRRRTISDGTLVPPASSSANDWVDALVNTSQAAQGKADASSTNRSAAVLNTPRSARIAKKVPSSPAASRLTRRATRLSGASAENVVTKLSALSKRGKKAVEKGVGRLTRELKRLQDTNEYAHIDTRPVRYTVWSNGKYVDIDPTQDPPAPEPPRKKAKVDENAAGNDETKPDEDKQEEGAPAARKPRVKKWLEKGLYAGQEAPVDIFKGLTSQEKKKLASIPELMPSGKPNRVLPQPMYNGLRILINGRDFKLPYDVCNPLPPGQPKPAAYRTMTKNRFVGNAAAYWKKTPHFEDFSSKCVCKPEDGCGEDCQNRIMLYECDETNCNVGKAHCTNRSFQDLQERTKKGGRYRVGVEVFKTPDRGYGVRSNRCFEPNQIIMEYTGEIITVEECERRMNEVYKDNECYYLMSFDQNMIIDATTGSIARFVNHSCSPNCRMIKWIVSGQPRMALFAGDRPIMTGEELTYDYNFDPFSAKNVQKCLCGSPNCRGVLGPKPKEVKPPKPTKDEKKAVKAASKSSIKSSAKGPTKPSGNPPAKSSVKRKLRDAFDFDGDDEEEAKTAKKRKIQAATGLKRTVSSTSLKTAKGAAKRAVKGAITIKRTVSSISVATKKKRTGFLVASSKAVEAKVTSKTKAATKTKTKTKTKTTIQRTTGKVTKKTYGKKASPTSSATATAMAKNKIDMPSRSPSLTIVAAGVSANLSTSTTTSSSSSAKTDIAKPSTPMSSSTKKAIPMLALSSGKKTSSRKVTPSRKAIESGLSVGTPLPSLSKSVVSKAKAGPGAGATTEAGVAAGLGTPAAEVKKTPTRIKLVNVSKK